MNKLKIEINGYLIEVEGDQKLVEKVYDDFKSGEFFSSVPVRNDAEQVSDEAKIDIKNSKRTRKRKVSVKSAKSEEGGASNAGSYSPKMDSSLDLSGLKEFYELYVTKNNAEKLLVFATFLHQEKSWEVVTADQLFTCFKTLKERIPKVFRQAIIDTKNKHAYLDYNSVDDIKVSTVGENYFNHDMEKQ